MNNRKLADDLERAIARHDKACADGNVVVTTMMDVTIKAIIRHGLPAILTALRAAPEGWRPIETDPPPRGKNLLLWAATDVAEDGTIRNWKMATGSACYSTGEWVWEGSRLKPYEVQPTHWRHTPEPPP